MKTSITRKMKTFPLAGSVFLSFFFVISAYGQDQEVKPVPMSDDLDVVSAAVDYHEDLDLFVFEQEVEGVAGGTIPGARGTLDGAPVLGYVFPTDLSPTSVGFNQTEGILALAVTSHPDFDDTPLWDEDGDQDYENDGIIWHTHWVVLVPDDRVPGELAVKEFQKEDQSVVLPPTNPGMNIYLDSPGLSVVQRGNAIRVLVPAYRIGGRKTFNYDAVTAYMEVNTSDEKRPMLGVYEVYDVLSGDLSLPYTIAQK